MAGASILGKMLAPHHLSVGTLVKMGNMDTLLQLQHVSFLRGGHPILQDVSFQSELGENWVILGPNGAGKTTLLSIMAAREYPSSGEANILGQRLGSVPVQQLHERVGLCSTAVLRVIPGIQTVKALILSAAYGTMVRGRDQDFEDIDYQRRANLMELFGVASLQERRLSTLSDGERQRVLIARALMADPEILILDEPVAGVDLQARELLLSALDELSSDPKSPQIVMVTHHLEEIPASFNRAALMKQGKIMASGEIDQVLTSENLSEAFSLSLKCARSDDGRWWAHAR